MADYIPPSLDWVREQVELYESSGGTKGTTLMDTGMPCILVTHTGNKTGRFGRSLSCVLKSTATMYSLARWGASQKTLFGSTILGQIQRFRYVIKLTYLICTSEKLPMSRNGKNYGPQVSPRTRPTMTIRQRPAERSLCLSPNHDSNPSRQLCE